MVTLSLVAEKSFSFSPTMKSNNIDLTSFFLMPFVFVDVRMNAA
jgi:hypothetical protein